MISNVRFYSKFKLGQLNAYKLMFAMKFSTETPIKFFWIAGFFLPAINATIFRSDVPEYQVVDFIHALRQIVISKGFAG